MDPVPIPKPEDQAYLTPPGRAPLTPESYWKVPVRQAWLGKDLMHEMLESARKHLSQAEVEAERWCLILLEKGVVPLIESLQEGKTGRARPLKAFGVEDPQSIFRERVRAPRFIALEKSREAVLEVRTGNFSEKSKAAAAELDKLVREATPAEKALQEHFDQGQKVQTLKEQADILWELKKLAILQKVREAVAGGAVVSVVVSVGNEVLTLFSTADLPIGAPPGGGPLEVSRYAFQYLRAWLHLHSGVVALLGCLVAAVAIPLAVRGRKRLLARLPPKEAPGPAPAAS